MSNIHFNCRILKCRKVLTRSSFLLRHSSTKLQRREGHRAIGSWARSFVQGQRHSSRGWSSSDAELFLLKTVGRSRRQRKFPSAEPRLQLGTPITCLYEPYAGRDAALLPPHLVTSVKKHPEPVNKHELLVNYQQVGKFREIFLRTSAFLSNEWIRNHEKLGRNVRALRVRQIATPS